MGTWKSKNRHKYLLQYHMIFVCKYRKKLLISKQISDDIKQFSHEICQKHFCKLSIAVLKIMEVFKMGGLPIRDMSNTFIEHSYVINNFVIMVGKQIKDSLCRVLGDGVQYQWHENDDQIIIPDISINCNTRDRKNVSLTGIPRVVVEVLSDATEEYDYGEKMEIYRRVGISEYWIVDWRKKKVEIYLNDGREDGTTYFYLYKTVMEENKEELQLVMFPNIKTDFDELFYI